MQILQPWPIAPIQKHYQITAMDHIIADSNDILNDDIYFCDWKSINDTDIEKSRLKSSYTEHQTDLNSLKEHLP